MTPKELQELERICAAETKGPFIDKKRPVLDCLKEMLDEHHKIYETLLETPGLAYCFSQLVNRACRWEEVQEKALPRLIAMVRELQAEKQKADARIGELETCRDELAEKLRKLESPSEEWKYMRDKLLKKWNLT